MESPSFDDPRLYISKFECDPNLPLLPSRPYIFPHQLSYSYKYSCTFHLIRSWPIYPIWKRDEKTWLISQTYSLDEAYLYIRVAIYFSNVRNIEWNNSQMYIIEHFGASQNEITTLISITEMNKILRLQMVK